MLIEKGQKVHVMYRALYENSVRRHFLGEVTAVEGALCRLDGYVFIYERKMSSYVRRPDKRATIIDLAESGYIVNLISQEVNLDKVEYKYLEDIGLVATDGGSLSLNINEYGAKS